MGDADCEIQAKENMLFSGTAIANGTVIGIVTSIGMSTEIGKIQSQIQVRGEEGSTLRLARSRAGFGRGYERGEEGPLWD